MLPWASRKKKHTVADFQCEKKRKSTAKTCRQNGQAQFKTAPKKNRARFIDTQENDLFVILIINLAPHEKPFFSGLSSEAIH